MLTFDDIHRKFEFVKSGGFELEALEHDLACRTPGTERISLPSNSHAPEKVPPLQRDILS